MAKEKKLQVQEYIEQKKSFIILSIAAVFGFCIWAFSPILTGYNEPWDAEYPFYILVSLGGGMGVGLLAPRYLTVCYLGVWFGQVLACAVLPGLDRSWLALGAITTGFGSLLVLIGAFIGSIIRKLLQHIKRKESQ